MDMNAAGCGQMHHGFDEIFFESSAYLGYVDECERKRALDAFAKILSTAEDVNDLNTLQNAANQTGITLEDFLNSPSSIEYVNSQLIKLELEYPY